MTRASLGAASPTTASRRSGGLPRVTAWERGVVLSMLAALALVTSLAWWDERREQVAALSDLEAEQSVLADSVSRGVQARVETLERDAQLFAARGERDAPTGYDPLVARAASAPPAVSGDPSRLVLTFPVGPGRVVDLGVSVRDLLEGDRGDSRAGDETLLLLAPPSRRELRAASGRTVSSSALWSALDQRLSAVRLTRSEASGIGLSERTAVAGLARAESPLGSWDVVAVTSAARERDREKRAVWRLVLSVLVASGLVGAFGGVTLRKQRSGLELAHRLQLSELEREQDEKLARTERLVTMGTFAMGVAHEVSTPLGVIVGRAEQLLGRVEGDERATRGAQAILSQADRIRSIVRRFLDMARGGPLSFATTDPSEVVRAASDAVEHRFAKAQVALATDVAEGLPPIQCDRAMLEQALVNLLLNACEAASPGGHVQLAIRCDGERVAFVVTDDGVGIDPAVAARAAEPFLTTKPAEKGTGLGLAIATEIAKSHRGALHIGPHAGGGTRACVEIPIAGAPATTAAG